MLREDIRFWTRAEPFKPFRIVMNAGSVYEVRHPEMVMLLLDSLIVGIPSTEEGEAESAKMIGLNLIDRIEPLTSPPPDEKAARKGKKR